MSVANKLPRSTRRSDYEALPGQTVFGPAPWLCFDAQDVVVRVRGSVSEPWRTTTTGVSVTLSASPVGFPTATFAEAQTGRLVRIEARRVHPRITDVTRAGSLQTSLLERELDAMASTLQELRRDIDDGPFVGSIFQSAGPALISPLNFGGKGDAVTDDSAAFDLARTATGAVWLPQGYVFAVAPATAGLVYGPGALKIDGVTFDQLQPVVDPYRASMFMTPKDYTELVGFPAGAHKQNVIFSVGSRAQTATALNRNTAFGGRNFTAEGAILDRNEAFGDGALRLLAFGERNSFFGSIAGEQLGTQDITQHAWWYEGGGFVPGQPGWDFDQMETRNPGIGAKIAAAALTLASSTADVARNAGFGRDALNGAVYGTDSVAFGYRALAGNFIADRNSAFGVDSLRRGVFLHGATAVGYRNGYLWQEGTDILLGGRDTFFNAVRGSNVIGLGFGVANSVADVNNTVLIGRNVLNGGGYTSLSNVFAMAMAAGNPLLSGKFDMGWMGINILPEALKGRFHVRSSDFGDEQDAHPAADELILESGGNTGVSIRSAAAAQGGIYFARAGASNVGGVVYDHATDRLIFRAAAGNQVEIGADGLSVADPSLPREPVVTRIPFADPAVRLAQRPVYEPFFGFFDGTTDTGITPGAGRAPQGLASVRHLGGDYDLIVIPDQTSGTDVRIVRFMRGTTAMVDMAPAMTLNHHAIGAYSDGVDIKIVYAGGPFDDPIEGDPLLNYNRGKSVSIMTYKGAATTSGDITAHRLFDDQFTAHYGARYCNSSIICSNDGQYIIAIANDYAANDRTNAARHGFVFRLADVVAAGADARGVMPIRSLDFQIPPGHDGNCFQDWSCDGRYIASFNGRIPPLGNQSIVVYSLWGDGRPLRIIAHDGIRSKYGRDGLLDFATRFPLEPDLGSPRSSEGEGISFDAAGDLLTLTIDDWRQTGPIVSYGPYNYALVSTAAGNADTSSPRETHWVQTTKAATHGAYTPGAVYTLVSNNTRRAKCITRVGRQVGAVGEQPLDAGIQVPRDMARFMLGQDWWDFGVQRGSQVMFGIADPFAHTMKRRFAIDDGRVIKIYDGDAAATDNYGSLVLLDDPTAKTLRLHPRGTTTAGGTSLYLHAADDPQGSGLFAGAAGLRRPSTGSALYLMRDTTVRFGVYVSSTNAVLTGYNSTNVCIGLRADSDINASPTFLAIFDAASFRPSGTKTLGSAANAWQRTYTGGFVIGLRVVTAAGAISLGDTDHTIVVNKAIGAATTVNLPVSPETGRRIVVKDGKADAASNNITITPAAGTIDGAASYVISSNRGHVALEYTGSEWAITGV